MVEGHSVHRVAAFHRKRLIGKTFKAWSPNGRFKDGAKLIDNKPFQKIEAVGKNLFAFFGGGEESANTKNEPNNDLVVVHIHFGMAGNWAVYHNTDIDPPPDPRPTNRLRLESDNTIADLHAMTVEHGTTDLYHSMRNKLGEDPLRSDADPDRLWTKIQKSKKSIGALVNDQSYFTGPGNIYRAEILYVAQIHPDRPGKDLSRVEFDRIWKHTVALLRRGYETGSILTVDPAEALSLGKPHLRRYVYNSASCPRCEAKVKTWNIAGRTCDACVRCQPFRATGTDGRCKQESPGTPDLVASDCVPFNSHCARESVAQRLADGGPKRLTVKELRVELAKRVGGEEIRKGVSKKELVELFEKWSGGDGKRFVSSEDAAMEKAVAGESLAVEHIAELAPGQARMARARAVGGMKKNGGVKRHSNVTRQIHKTAVVKVEENEQNNGTSRTKKTNTVKVDEHVPNGIISSNKIGRVKTEDNFDHDRKDCTVFVSSKRAAITKSAVGTILAENFEFNSVAVDRNTSNLTNESDNDVTVLVSSQHAEIKPVAVGNILRRNASVDSNDKYDDQSTISGKRNIMQLTVSNLKLELNRRGIKFCSNLSKAALASLLESAACTRKRKR